ncbi:MAG: phage virion morphogenesis protein [Rhodoblastus sp.]
MSIPVVVRITVKDLASADAKIAEVLGKVKDTAGLLGSIGEAERTVVLSRFAEKVAPDGSAWPANKPLTLMLAGGKGSMMNRSGALKGSIQFQVAGASLSLGPNTKYAAVQQFGATIKAKGAALAIPIPAGTFMSNKQASGLGVGMKRSRGKNDGDGGRSNKDAVLFLQKVTISPRPYIGIGPKDEEAIRNAIVDWLSIEG